MIEKKRNGKKMKAELHLFWLCLRSIPCLNTASSWHVRRGRTVWSKHRAVARSKQRQDEKQRGKKHGNLFRSRHIKWRIHGGAWACAGRRSLEGENVQSRHGGQRPEMRSIDVCHAIRNRGKTQIRTRWFASTPSFFFCAANATLKLWCSAERYFMVSRRLIGGGAPARSECLVSICAAMEPLNFQFRAACGRRHPLSLEMRSQLVASAHGGGGGGGTVLAEPAPKTGRQ